MASQQSLPGGPSRVGSGPGASSTQRPPSLLRPDPYLRASRLAPSMLSTRSQLYERYSCSSPSSSCIRLIISTIIASCTPQPVTRMRRTTSQPPRPLPKITAEPNHCKSNLSFHTYANEFRTIIVHTCKGVSTPPRSLCPPSRGALGCPPDARLESRLRHAGPAQAENRMPVHRQAAIRVHSGPCGPACTCGDTAQLGHLVYSVTGYLCISSQPPPWDTQTKAQAQKGTSLHVICATTGPDRVLGLGRLHRHSSAAAGPGQQVSWQPELKAWGISALTLELVLVLNRTAAAPRPARH